MSSILASAREIQQGISNLQLFLAVKEYNADWFPGGQKVTRDSSGRFASRDSIGDTVKSVSSVVEITVDAIAALLKDPDFRESIRLVAGKTAYELLQAVNHQWKTIPGFDEHFQTEIKKFDKSLEKLFGDDKTPMAQAIRKAQLPELPKDAPLDQKVEFAIARYKAYVDVLKNPENFNDEEDTDSLRESVAQTIKAAIPVLGMIAILIGPDIALGVLAKRSLQQIFIATAASNSIGLALEKLTETGLKKTGVPLEKLQEKHPNLYFAADMAYVTLLSFFIGEGVGHLSHRPKIQHGDAAPVEIVKKDLTELEKNMKRVEQIKNKQLTS
jgi:hypothetical protein